MYMATTHTKTFRPVNMVSRILVTISLYAALAKPHRQPRQQVMASKGAKPGKIAYWGAEVGLVSILDRGGEDQAQLTKRPAGFRGPGVEAGLDGATVLAVLGRRVDSSPVPQRRCHRGRQD